MFITSPENFAEWFNEKYPGTFRRITPEDVKDMTDCGLIGHYRYYSQQDLETVRGVLQYEKIRAKIAEKAKTTPINGVPCCKICGQNLPDSPTDKKGRHKEYCPNCEPLRAK